MVSPPLTSNWCKLFNKVPASKLIHLLIRFIFFYTRYFWKVFQIFFLTLLLSNLSNRLYDSLSKDFIYFFFPKPFPILFYFIFPFYLKIRDSLAHQIEFHHSIPTWRELLATSFSSG